MEEYINYKRLEILAKLQKKIVSAKYVLGDDIIEVTATDIKQASKMIDLPSRASSAKIIFKLYIVFGFVASLFSIFFETILDTIFLLFKNPAQVMLFFSGLFMVIIGYVMLQRIRIRETEQYEKMGRASTMNIQNAKVEIYQDSVRELDIEEEKNHEEG